MTIDNKRNNISLTNNAILNLQILNKYQVIYVYLTLIAFQYITTKYTSIDDKKIIISKKEKRKKKGD